MFSQRSIKNEFFISGAGTTKKLHLGGQEISSKKVHYCKCSLSIIGYGPKCICCSSILSSLV